MMTYWTDDRALDLEQRRLDANQARAKRAMEAAQAAERERLASALGTDTDTVDALAWLFGRQP